MSLHHKALKHSPAANHDPIPDGKMLPLRPEVALDVGRRLLQRAAQPLPARTLPGHTGRGSPPAANAVIVCP